MTGQTLIGTLEAPSRAEIKSLTSFRFIAAFYVFLFHLQIREPLVETGPIAALLAEGAVGMTMFFMLSGFILAYVYGTKPFDISQFIRNRFSRIYPVYFIAAILALPWLFMETFRSQYIWIAIGQFSMLFVTGVFMLQAWFHYSFSFWNNSASWSLSNEAYFYALFPLFSRILGKLSPQTLIALFAACTIFSTAIPISFYLFEAAKHSTALFYILPAYRILEFIAGIIVYLLLPTLPQTRLFSVALHAVTIGAIGLVVVAGPALPTYTALNFAVIPGVAAILIILFRIPDSRQSIWSSVVLVYLGKISYCFYSFQFHVLEGIPQILDVDQIGPITFGLLSLCTLLIVSSLAYHLIEEPCRRLLKKSNRNPVGTK